jgi:peptidoglycan-N-acetylglucosamine deacetylase
MSNPFSFGAWRPVIRRQPPGVSDVALTFDDGPSPATTLRILEILTSAGARATFFLSGVRVEAAPGLTADIVAAGHDVFGHGWEHEDYWHVDPALAVKSMLRVEDRLSRLRPTPSPYLVRLPFNAGFNVSRMHRAMALFHPDACFAWFSHNLRDYLLATCCSSAEELAARCRAVARELQDDSGLPGAVLLLHEDPFMAPGTLAPRVSVTILPMILDALRARGLGAGPIYAPAGQRWRDRYVYFGRGRGHGAWVPSLVHEAGRPRPGLRAIRSLVSRSGRRSAAT